MTSILPSSEENIVYIQLIKLSEIVQKVLIESMIPTSLYDCTASIAHAVDKLLTDGRRNIYPLTPERGPTPPSF